MEHLQITKVRIDDMYNEIRETQLQVQADVFWEHLSNNMPLSDNKTMIIQTLLSKRAKAESENSCIACLDIIYKFGYSAGLRSGEKLFSDKTD